MADAVAPRRAVMGPMARETVITHALALRGARVVYYLCALDDHYRQHGPARMVNLLNDSEAVAALAFTCVDQTQPVGVEKDSQVIVQTIVSGLTNDMLPTIEDTRRFIVLQMRILYQGQGADQQAAMLLAQPAPAAGQPANAVPALLTQALPAAGQEALQATDDLIIWWVRGMKAKADMKSVTIRTLTSGMLMYCKQGTVTPNVQMKIQNAIRDEMQYNINIDIQAIRCAWSIVAPYMDAVKARRMFAHWTHAVGNANLRLRLLISQVGWNSMTNYQNIHQARDHFPDFPWARLAQTIGADFANFQRAVERVNNDEFYGYNPDLGPAKSTNYPHLAYCAFALLTDVRGDQALRQFQGVNTRLEYRGIIDDMVREYRNTRDANARNAVVGPGAIQHARLFLQGNHAEIINAPPPPALNQNAPLIQLNPQIVPPANPNVADDPYI